jgi:hypothetical protein
MEEFISSLIQNHGIKQLFDGYIHVDSIGGGYIVHVGGEMERERGERLNGEVSVQIPFIYRRFIQILKGKCLHPSTPLLNAREEYINC